MSQLSYCLSLKAVQVVTVRVLARLSDYQGDILLIKTNPGTGDDEHTGL